MTSLMMNLFIFMFITNMVYAKRGRRVDLASQKGGDILQLRSQYTIWGKMRNALTTNSLSRWTDYRDSARNYVIPFVVTGDFTTEERSVIYGAMRAIERNTCIRFKKRLEERDFLDIRNERNEGCYTAVGRSRGRNVMMLESNFIATCIEHDIVLHELLHAIGLYHEQQRFDRDRYIKVNYDRIGPEFYTQFEKISKMESTTYGVNYDYRSIMHYSKDAFAAMPGDITMETKDRNFQEIIGKVTDASPSDYLKVCSIYKCKICMAKPFERKSEILSALMAYSG